MKTVSQILSVLDAQFPFARAESWDKTGLLVGDEHASINRVLVCYEVTGEALDEAQKHGCELLVAYHPLIFRPLDKLDFSDRTAGLCARLIRQNQNLVCVHTALDGADQPNALGDALARQLGLDGAQVHKPSGVQKLVQITYFVAPQFLEATREAAWKAGAGSIGNYDKCSATNSSQGTFRPLEGANPSVGTVGELSQELEVRVELLAPQDKFAAILEAIKSAQGYEELAYFVSPLLNKSDNQKYGPLRLAAIPGADLEEWIERAKTRFNVPSVRVARPDDGDTFRFVACSPGSGASFISSLPKGTIFISGDFKHHDALLAKSRGVALIDVTHAATETAAVELLAGALNELEDIEVVRGAMRNPFDFA